MDEYVKCFCGENTEVRMYKQYTCVTGKCNIYCEDKETEEGIILTTIRSYIEEEDVIKEYKQDIQKRN